jgi:hypothetical protein
VRQLNTCWREALAVVNDEEPSNLGAGGKIVEADQTATHQSKYQRGKRQRKAGVVWWSTAVRTKVSETEKRRAENVMVRLAPQRDKETL